MPDVTSTVPTYYDVTETERQHRAVSAVTYTHGVCSRADGYNINESRAVTVNHDGETGVWCGQTILSETRHLD